MTIMKSLSGALLAATLVAGPAAAQDPTFFRIGTGGAGGTYFPIGGTIANGISSPPGSRACEDGGQCGVPGLIAIAQSTTASVFNNAAVQNGERNGKVIFGVMLSKSKKIMDINLISCNFFYFLAKNIFPLP